MVQPRARLSIALALIACSLGPAITAQAGPSGRAPDGVLAPASAEAMAAVAALAVPPVDPHADAWVAPGEGRYLIDDFEAGAWPDSGVWPVVTDLTGVADGDYTWAPSRCRAAGGGTSLWAVGGGADGAQLACGASYPSAQQTSAVLALDLAALHSAGQLALVFDVWADAAADEGLFINYLTFGAGGAVTGRRTVYSATGRPGAWSRDIRLDLTALRDAHDPRWTLDLRGARAYLELLFLSVPAVRSGEGIFVDNVVLDARPRPPVVVTPVPSPTPAGGNRTVACAAEPDCRSVTVSAFVDYRCDGRFRNGVDYYPKGPVAVEVIAGADQLGTTLDRWGNATFKVHSSAGAEVRLTVPAGYETCPYSPTPRNLASGDFKSTGVTAVKFGLARRR